MRYRQISRECKKGRFQPVRGNTPNHPITYSRPSQLSPGSTRQLSLAHVSTRPLCQLVPESTRPRVNSSPGQLEPGSTRTRVNSSASQLVPVSTRPGSTRPRVNSSPCHTSSPSQLVPESTRPRVNSSSSQHVPGSTRPRVNSRLHLSLVNLHPRQLAPTSTRTRVIPQPSQLAPRSTRTQVPAYHTTHLHYLPPESTLTRVNSSRVNSHSPLCQLVPCVNSSPSQLVPGSTRDCTCPWSTCTHVNLHPRLLAPESSRNRVNSHPGQLAPRYLPITLPTYLSTYTTSHLPKYLPTSFHSSPLQTCIPTSPTLHTPPCLLLCLPTPSLHYLTSHSLPPYLHTVPP